MKRLRPKETEMPLRAARRGRVGVIGAPVAKTAVVAKAVSPGPSPGARAGGVAAAPTPGGAGGGSGCGRPPGAPQADLAAVQGLGPLAAGGRAIDARTDTRGVDGTLIKPRVGRSRSKVTSSSNVTSAAAAIIAKSPRPRIEMCKASSASAT